MSKAEGKKIAIKFTQPLIGDVSGLTPIPTGGFEELTDRVGTYTASSQWNNGPQWAFNSSLFWDTRSTGTQWIQIRLTTPRAFHKFKWYSQMYRANEFRLLGSNDGVNFNELFASSSPNTSDWHTFEFVNDTAYEYYRWEIMSRHSSWLYIYEINMYYKVAKGNEAAVTVTGQVPKYVEYPEENLGPLEEKTLAVQSVSTHPSEPNSLLLTMKDMNEFKNIEGSLTVSYDASKGNLTGLGGPVASFTEVFTPTDLVRTPNPLLAETLDVSITGLEVDLIPIVYKNGYSDDEIIAVSITDFSVDLIHVGELDP